MGAVLKLSGKIGGGIFAVILVVLVLWFVSALWWGGIAFLVWNVFNLHHVFGAGTFDYFWEGVGIGALMSLVLG